MSAIGWYLTIVVVVHLLGWIWFYRAIRHAQPWCAAPPLIFSCLWPLLFPFLLSLARRPRS